MEEKCLVTEAQEKCQCERCKWSREMIQISLKQTIGMEAQRIWIEAMKEAGGDCNGRKK